MQYYLNGMDHFGKDGLQFKVMKDMDAYNRYGQHLSLKLRTRLIHIDGYYVELSLCIAIFPGSQRKQLFFIKENCL